MCWCRTAMPVKSFGWVWEKPRHTFYFLFWFYDACNGRKINRGVTHWRIWKVCSVGWSLLYENCKNIKNTVIYRLVATCRKKKQVSTFLPRSLPNKWARKGESEDHAKEERLTLSSSFLLPSWLTSGLASDLFAVKVQYGGGWCIVDAKYGNI